MRTPEERREWSDRCDRFVAELAETLQGWTALLLFGLFLMWFLEKLH